jgi:hypothetical protein
MLNPFDAPRRVWCHVHADAVERIDRLVDRVNCRTPWGERVTRTEVLRALVRSGLDLATLRVFAIDYLKEEPAQRLRFKLLPSEFERVTSLQKDYVEGLSNVAKPPLASLHQALIQLGLLEAERNDGFLSFAEEVKLSRWLWRASQRRGRGAAEARRKDQLAADAGDTLPSNDVDDGERPALAAQGRGLLVDALRGSTALPSGFAPSPEAQSRLRALAITALDEAIADEAMRFYAERVSGPPAEWRERVLHAIEETEARGPTSRERPRCPP